MQEQKQISFMLSTKTMASNEVTGNSVINYWFPSHTKLWK